ncbi:MAG: HDOD domain-containing protein [Dehalococcoidia bacterium]
MPVAANRKSQDEVLRTLASLPPLPAIALRVMQVAQDPKSSASDLAQVVSLDPGLTASVLRVTNSAAYRRNREVTSVQEALVVLGFVQARNIAISGAITGSYAPDAANALFRIQAFWRHSLAVALRASWLAMKSGRVAAPTAFTAGILHNMGRLAMFYADAAGLDQVVAEAMRTGKPLEEAETELLGYDHAQLGQLLAMKWRLPSEVRDAIGSHHGEEREDTLPGILAMADRYCCDRGVLPGYVLPQPRAGTAEPEFVKLMKEVDSLMELIDSHPVGVRL